MSFLLPSKRLMMVKINELIKQNLLRLHLCFNVGVLTLLILIKSGKRRIRMEKDKFCLTSS
jgi:hypothetical protein